MDRYLTDIREVERRIQMVEARNTSGEERQLAAAPAGVPDSFKEHVELMFDIQALAFAADVTREDEVADYVRAAVDKFGAIDVFYNNAGIGTDRQCIVQSVEYQTRALDQREYEALRARDNRRERGRDYR